MNHTQFHILYLNMVHLVLHPHGIASIFLKLDLWSPVAGFIPNISTKGINQIKKKIVRKEKKFYAFLRI